MHDDDHVSVPMMSTYVISNADSDNSWDYLKILGYDYTTSTVINTDMKEEEDTADDDQSVVLDMEECDIILETSPLSDDNYDNNDEDLFPTSPLCTVLVDTPNASDEE